MKSIELGDIGLKYGLNETDNGYAVFTQHRVPRTNLLMRHAQLLKDGSYIKAKNAKHAYSTLTATRNAVLHGVCFPLAQAATIAIRYSVVREQGHGYGKEDMGPESSILSYRSQNRRLLTHMARAFTFWFASQASHKIYTETTADQHRGFDESLPYTHMLTAALKAYSTQTATESIEDCRKCCDGHGYSELSGLPHIIANVLPSTTLESDNHVMYLQAARYLVKTASQIRLGHTVGSRMEFLSEGYRKLYPGIGINDYAHEIQSVHLEQSYVNLGDTASLARAVEERFIRVVFACESQLRRTQRDVPADVAPNKHLMTLISVARVFAETFALTSFSVGIESASLSEPAKAVMVRLCKLQALDTITTPATISPSFLEHSGIEPNTLKDMRMAIGDILDELLCDAITLTDSWGFSDASLASALGVYDGNVYETMMEWTRQIPINRQAAENGGVDCGGYNEYIKKLLRPRL